MTDRQALKKYVRENGCSMRDARVALSPPIAKYPCTQCGGDATVGMSDWKQSAGIKRDVWSKPKVVIGKKERLCVKCANTRLGTSLSPTRKEESK